MKKISPFSLYLSLLVVKEGTDINDSQLLILLLVTMIFVVIFGLAVFLIVWRLIRIGRAYRKLVTNGLMDEPDTHWKKGEGTELNMNTFTEQQWLFNQFLSQGHEDFETHDLLDGSNDWLS